jgi:hypothetical protein
MTGRTNPPPGVTPEGLTDYRLAKIEEAVSTMAESMNSLVALEQKHTETREALGRAFKANEDLEGRVRVLELDMVGVKQSRGWLQSAGTIVATAFITGAATILLPHVMK